MFIKDTFNGINKIGEINVFCILHGQGTIVFYNELFVFVDTNNHTEAQSGFSIIRRSYTNGNHAVEAI